MGIARSINMKKIYTVIIILITFSCHDNVKPVYTIYNDWQWVKSTFDTRGRPITPQDVDSIHYISFSKEGKVIVKNNNKEIVSEYKVVFETTDNQTTYKIQDSEKVFGYIINTDTLSIWQANSIWPKTDFYKIAKPQN